MRNKLITSSEVNANRLRFRSIDKWLHWQESLHFTAIELGLERCRRVANNMGLLNPSYNVISVAGTNGKGSSIIMLDRILLLLIYFDIMNEFVLMETRLVILNYVNHLIGLIEQEEIFHLHILNLAHLQH